VRFLPAHPERNVADDGESLLALDMHRENARRVWATINERTLADNFWPAPKRMGARRGCVATSIALRTEHHARRRELRLRPGEWARKGRREARSFGQDFCSRASRQPYCNEFIR
jgi:hypothetical protein